MRCEKIMSILKEQVPESFAEEWDNVGLLAGDPGKDVRKILVALDASDGVIDQAEALGADMLITHHPLIFSPVKKITADDFIGRRICRLIRGDIAYYAMHTNYDMVRMADEAAKRLDLKEPQILESVCTTGGTEYGFGKTGKLKEPMTLGAYAEQVRELFGLPGIAVYGDPDRIVKMAAICPGSGKSFLSSAVSSKADVYITGDVDYHFGTDANARGIAVMDAGHYGIEHIFIEDMCRLLEQLLDGEVQVFAMPVEHPYVVI